VTELRALIAEDEAVARRRLRRLLEEAGGVQVVAEVEDGVALLERLREREVDLVLLDIRMPRLSGLEALALMEPGGPQVVVTTAHAEHAVEAFARDAADYLLKPVEPERLALALERVRRRLGERPAAGALPERLVVPTRHGLVLLRPDEVECALIEGASCLVFARGTRFVTDFRLSDLERRLPPARFRRVHRQALVDVERIERLEPTPTGGYVAFLHGGREVPVSRQEARELRRLWDLPR